MDPHSNIVIKHHGNYIQNRPYSLIPMAKNHTPLLATMIINNHNPTILSIWRANVDFQPVLSIHAVQKYIAKYASKAEKKNIKASTTCYVELSWLHPLLTQQHPHFENFLQKPLLIVTLEHRKPVICSKNYH